jgi:hypothetical protein
MVRLLARVMGIGIETADMLVQEVLHYRGDDHDARHRSHKRPMHQLAAPLRRLQF